MKNNNRYVCTVCGYVYDNAVEDIPFEELDEDFVCQVCGEPKSAFVLETEDGLND